MVMFKNVVDQLDNSALRRDLAKVTAQRDKLLKACEEVMVWVAVATAKHPYANPKGVENAEKDLAMLKSLMKECQS